MAELKCPECGADNVTVDDSNAVDGSPRQGWLIFRAYCGDPDEGHWFKVIYTMRYLKVWNIDNHRGLKPIELPNKKEGVPGEELL